MPLTPERRVGKVRKKLPIGIDGFEKIRTNDFYYVDKTLFIKELLQNWGGGKSVYPSQALWKNIEYEHAEAFF